MIPDAIKSRLKASPFKAFMVRLVSGEKYIVRHPEMISLSPGGRHMILWVGEDRYVDLDALLIESIAQANGHSGGRGRRRSA